MGGPPMDEVVKSHTFFISLVWWHEIWQSKSKRLPKNTKCKTYYMRYSDVYTLGNKNINFNYIITYFIETIFDHSNMFGDHQPKK